MLYWCYEIQVLLHDVDTCYVVMLYDALLYDAVVLLWKIGYTVWWNIGYVELLLMLWKAKFDINSIKRKLWLQVLCCYEKRFQYCNIVILWKNCVKNLHCRHNCNTVVSKLCKKKYNFFVSKQVQIMLRLVQLYYIKTCPQLCQNRLELCQNSSKVMSNRSKIMSIHHSFNSPLIKSNTSNITSYN